MVAASRMSCGAVSSFHQRQQPVEGFKEGILAGLKSPRVGGAFPFERASMDSPALQ